jgi:hypothetical protein
MSGFVVSATALAAIAKAKKTAQRIICKGGTLPRRSQV